MQHRKKYFSIYTETNHLCAVNARATVGDNMNVLRLTIFRNAFGPNINHATFVSAIDALVAKIYVVEGKNLSLADAGYTSVGSKQTKAVAHFRILSVARISGLYFISALCDNINRIHARKTHS